MSPVFKCSFTCFLWFDVTNGPFHSLSIWMAGVLQRNLVSVFILNGVFFATESYWLEAKPQHYLFVL